MLNFKIFLFLLVLCIKNIIGQNVNIVVKVYLPDEKSAADDTDASVCEKNGPEVTETSSTTEPTTAMETITLSLEQQYKKEGYGLVEKTGRWYKFHIHAKNWTVANSTCVAEGAHLAIVDSIEERDVLLELFAKYIEKIQFAGGQLSMAIGLYRDGADWKTIDGQALEKTGFAEWDWKYPSTDLLYLNTPYIPMYGYLTVLRGGKLQNESGEYRHAFVCKK